tara:strand:- start:229 stop:510 length:282 start_codon:yes stop_codon:yes gene_type:complete
MEVVVIPLLVPSMLLEMISVGFRSFSLGFRVFANIAAGHVLSDIALVARYVHAKGFLAVISHSTFSYVVMAYEFVVSCIQLGVFSSLISVYVE